jgi:hypothetical protein
VHCVPGLFYGGKAAVGSADHPPHLALRVKKGAMHLEYPATPIACYRVPNFLLLLTKLLLKYSVIQR